jgi:Raf kinase inhibitor-like YbhB/YbcL family protein
LAAAGCGGDDTVKGPPPQAPKTIQVTSPAFSDGGTIPAAFTCEGQNVSPPVAWRHLPSGTRNVALLMEDPDAPNGTFVHWSVFSIPPVVVGVGANRLPVGARQGKNSFGDEGYGGPCPPAGDAPHRYVISVYAPRSPLDLAPGAAPAAVRAAIAKQAIAEGTLTAKFGR